MHTSDHIKGKWMKVEWCSATRPPCRETPGLHIYALRTIHTVKELSSLIFKGSYVCTAGTVDSVHVLTKEFVSILEYSVHLCAWNVLLIDDLVLKETYLADVSIGCSVSPWGGLEHPIETSVRRVSCKIKLSIKRTFTISNVLHWCFYFTADSAGGWCYCTSLARLVYVV